MNLNEVKTGDVLLVSCNTFAGGILKVITLTPFNHIDVAIRIDESYLPRIKILKTGGTLCILQAKCPFKTVLQKLKYRLVLRKIDINTTNKQYICRSVKEEIYNDSFFQKVVNYIGSNIVEFNENEKISAVDNVIDCTDKTIPLTIRNKDHFLSPKSSNICSELAFSFYSYTVGHNIFKTDKYVILPHHFTEPNFNDFFDSEKMLKQNSDTITLLTAILVAVSFFGILIYLIYMSYNGKVPKLYILYFLIFYVIITVLLCVYYK
jgi:hypothetical protein